MGSTDKRVPLTGTVPPFCLPDLGTSIRKSWELLGCPASPLCSGTNSGLDQWLSARGQLAQLWLCVLDADFCLVLVFCFSHLLHLLKKKCWYSLIIGLNAVAADKDDKISHAHYHGNLQQLFCSSHISPLLFDDCMDVWFQQGLALELSPQKDCWGSELRDLVLSLSYGVVLEIAS